MNASVEEDKVVNAEECHQRRCVKFGLVTCWIWQNQITLLYVRTLPVLYPKTNVQNQLWYMDLELEWCTKNNRTQRHFVGSWAIISFLRSSLQIVYGAGELLCASDLHHLGVMSDVNRHWLCQFVNQARFRYFFKFIWLPDNHVSTKHWSVNLFFTSQMVHHRPTESGQVVSMIGSNIGYLRDSEHWVVLYLLNNIHSEFTPCS